MEFINLDNTRIAKYGHGEETIIGLHGWAGAYSDLDVFGNWLDPEKYTLYAVELPGRGKTKALECQHTVDELVSFLQNTIDQLNLKSFYFISDSGFSQVTIKYSLLKSIQIKGLLFLYSPALQLKPPKWYHYWVYPVVYSLASVRIFDPIFNGLRQSNWFMYGIFINGIIKSKTKEAKRLELIDINNKRNADIRAIFQSAKSILKTNVSAEWMKLNCPIEIVLAEKDPIINTQKMLPRLITNKNANITIVKDNHHQWDEEFIQIMRDQLVKLMKR
jgi:pimeloyl-ACP methyl ester carboxylesterase